MSDIAATVRADSVARLEADPVERAASVTLRWLVVVALVAATAGAFLTRHFLVSDLVVIGAVALLCLGAAKWPALSIPTLSVEGPLARLASLPALLAASLALALAAWLTGRFVLLDTALSRDEQMVWFDAANFAAGRLAAPLAETWRPFHAALNAMFHHAVPDAAARLSSYLPVNALLHAGGLRLGLADWVNPALAALALLATGSVAWQVTRDRAATGLAVAMLATSVQVWALSGTVYAMAGHLALNMVWLSLVLRDRAWAHALAVPVAFLATGLHQLLFHPLFAGPFVLWLAWRRRWAAFAWHVAAYAAIGLFWALFPAEIVSAVSPTGAPPETGARPDPVTMALALLGDFSADSIKLMAANLVRFVSWQNLALVPLAVLAAAHIRATRRPVEVALAASICATPVAVGLLLAYQGHGWGYRYMHGVLGLACVLAAIGWKAHGARLNGLVGAGTVATLLFAAPWQLHAAHGFTAPYAAAHAAIRASDADIVLVDAGAAPFAVDLATNGPTLARPIVMIERMLEPAQLAALCARRRIVRADPKIYARIAASFAIDAAPTHTLAPCLIPGDRP